MPLTLPPNTLLNGSDPREPAAWLATIARNECWARIRARMREPLGADQLDTVAGHDDPLESAIRRADLAALWAAIEGLPHLQRDALLLREFGGLTYDELGEALAVSGSAVESLLFRARQRLRVQLRTAYASFSGVQWVDALVRLIAGGGGPAAAKVAALGVGAAAVGGGAVVVPHVLENHTHLRPPAHAPAAPQHEQPVARRRTPPPESASPPVATQSERLTSMQRGERPVEAHQSGERGEGAQAVLPAETLQEPAAGGGGRDGGRDELGRDSGFGSSGGRGEGESEPSSGESESSSGHGERNITFERVARVWSLAQDVISGVLGRGTPNRFRGGKIGRSTVDRSCKPGRRGPGAGSRRDARALRAVREPDLPVLPAPARLP